MQTTKIQSGQVPVETQSSFRQQHAHPGNAQSKNSLSSISSLLRRRMWSLSLYTSALVSEVRSLVPRIRYRLNRNLDAGGVDLGTVWKTQPHGPLLRNTRTQSRIRDTQCMLATLPWATAADLAIFLEGWDRGAEWQWEESRKPYNAQPEG